MLCAAQGKKNILRASIMGSPRVLVWQSDDFLKLITTGQRNLQHFPISFYNIQSVRNASPILPREAEAQPTPAADAEFTASGTHIYSNRNSLFHPPLEQNLVSKRVG